MGIARSMKIPNREFFLNAAKVITAKKNISNWE
jgi:hypothetical protein